LPPAQAGSCNRPPTRFNVVFDLLKFRGEFAEARNQTRKEALRRAWPVVAARFPTIGAGRKQVNQAAASFHLTYPHWVGACSQPALGNSTRTDRIAWPCSAMFCLAVSRPT